MFERCFRDAAVRVLFVLTAFSSCVHSVTRATCILLIVSSCWNKMEEKEKKKHRAKHSGPKAEKKRKRYLNDLGIGDEENARKRNPKAFTVQSAVRMARTFHR